MWGCAVSVQSDRVWHRFPIKHFQAHLALRAVTQTAEWTWIGKLSGKQAAKRKVLTNSAALHTRKRSHKIRSRGKRWKEYFYQRDRAGRYYSNVFSLQQRPYVNHPKGKGRGSEEVIIYQSREDLAGETLAGAGLKWSPVKSHEWGGRVRYTRAVGEHSNRWQTPKTAAQFVLMETTVQ